MFHRVDIAVATTVRSHAAAQDIMGVAKAMGALFGTGEWRALFRGTQAALGAPRRVLPDQGAHPQGRGHRRLH